MKRKSRFKERLEIGSQAMGILASLAIVLTFLYGFFVWKDKYFGQKKYEDVTELVIGVELVSKGLQSAVALVKVVKEYDIFFTIWNDYDNKYMEVQSKVYEMKIRTKGVIQEETTQLIEEYMSLRSFCNGIILDRVVKGRGKGENSNQLNVELSEAVLIRFNDLYDMKSDIVTRLQDELAILRK